MPGNDSNAAKKKYNVFRFSLKRKNYPSSTVDEILTCRIAYTQSTSVWFLAKFKSPMNLMIAKQKNRRERIKHQMSEDWTYIWT